MKIKKYNEFYDTESFVDVDVEKLMNEVEKDCGNKSDLDVISEHKSYKDVVKNGQDSIPSIIEKIKNDNCHMIWFKALEEITNIYNDHYKYDDINNFWKKWAIKNGY